MDKDKQLSLFDEFEKIEEVVEEKPQITYQSEELIKNGIPTTLNSLNNLLHQKQANQPLIIDSVVMNPPYSLNWNELSDERFEGFGIAPKSKADYAFLLHGFHSLANTGLMAILLPHGPLFRGSRELTIRKALLEKKHLNAVIGLPEKLFSGTSIPTIVLLLTKEENKDVLFIDASTLCDKEKANNVIKFEHIEQIAELIVDRKFVDKLAYVASHEEIKGNDYNLNIPRYVDTFEEPEPIDMREVLDEMKTIDKEIAKTEQELAEMMADLIETNGDGKILQEYAKYFKGVK